MKFNLQISDIIAIYGASLSSILFYLEFLKPKKPVWQQVARMYFEDKELANIFIIYNKSSKPLIICDMSLEVNEKNKYYSYDIIPNQDSDDCKYDLKDGATIKLLPILSIPAHDYLRFNVTLDNRKEMKKSPLIKRKAEILKIQTVDGKSYRVKNTR